MKWWRRGEDDSGLVLTHLEAVTDDLELITRQLRDKVRNLQEPHPASAESPKDSR